MAESIERELRELPEALMNNLQQHGFRHSEFVERVRRLTGRGADDNRVDGDVRPPEPGDVVDVTALPEAERSRCAERGKSAMARGEVALVVLAGGMATRMGGVVKALVEALPGRTFLDLRLAEQQAHAQRSGQAPPLWLMTSDATDAGIREALGDRRDGYQIATFQQNLSLRVTPDGHVFRDASGQPSVHAPGHGDLPDALRRSGLLETFTSRGGTVVMVANLDNLGATLDETLIGLHLEGGCPVSCEVVRKVGTDRGGIPVRHAGRTVIVEEFRLPRGFDPTAVPVFNTNTFYFDAETLRSLDIPWTYFVVEKKVDGTPVVQFERLVNEVTSHLDTRYLEVPRDGSASRFLPVKDPAELERRRPELSDVARTRGLLP